MGFSSSGYLGSSMGRWQASDPQLWLRTPWWDWVIHSLLHPVSSWDPYRLDSPSLLCPLSFRPEWECRSIYGFAFADLCSPLNKMTIPLLALELPKNGHGNLGLILLQTQECPSSMHSIWGYWHNLLHCLAKQSEVMVVTRRGLREIFLHQIYLPQNEKNNLEMPHVDKCCEVRLTMQWLPLGWGS